MPNLLFHYTDAGGLLGIVQKKVLWASDAEYLNDAQELQFGRQRLYQALIAEADSIEVLQAADDAAASRATVMRSAAAHLYPGGMYARTSYHSVYVACFCEGGDVLSQWRAYAGGGGFALGFDRDVLPRVNFGELAEAPQLLPVQYGDTALFRMVDSVMEAVAPHPSGHPGATGFQQAASVVLPALAQVKHGAFSEEREWRLVTTSQLVGGLSFRARRGWLVPYLTASLPVGAVLQVVVGPGPDADLRERGVRRLLQASGMADVELKQSDAPFRG